MLTFETYCDRLFRALDLAIDDEIRNDSNLADIGMDSLDLFELLVFTEQIAGLMSPPTLTPEFITLGDAYNYYVQSVEWAAEP